jgi:hypothetical protein
MIPTRTVKIISVIGMKEKINPNEQAAALSHKAFFVKLEIVRYKICENLVIIFLRYVFRFIRYYRWNYGG